MTKAVFFDAGNTLFTERTSRGDLYARVAARHGVVCSAAEAGAAMHAVHEALPPMVDGHFRYSDGWFRVYIRKVFDRLGAAESPTAEVERELFDTFQRSDSFRVFDDVRPALARCRARGLWLGVISNWSPALPVLLGRLGLADSFDAVLTSAEELLEKPDVRLFERAVAIAGCAPRDALHVGDRPDADHDGARAAGLRAVLLDRAGTNGSDGVTWIGSLDALDMHLDS
jgi:putative hydrolase of the HAD superfamily